MPKPALAKEPSWLTSRAMVIGVGILLTVGLALGYARDMWAGLIWEWVTDLPVAIAWLASATAGGWAVLRCFRLPDECAQRSLRLLTATAIGFGLFSLAALFLGMAGCLNFATALAIPIVAIAAWLAVWHRPLLATLSNNDAMTPVIQWLKEPAGASALWLLALPTLAIALTASSTLPGILWKHGDPQPYDVLAYHLQIPRQWFEAGRISLLKENCFSCFPMNQEMHYLLLMTLFGSAWKAMYACQFLSLCLMVLAVLAARALVLSGPIRKNTRLAATVAGLLAAGTPWIPMLGSTCYIESGLLFFGTLATAWVFSTESANSTLRRLAIAGVMAGFAAGVKYTAVPLMLIALPLAALLLMRGQTWRRMAIGLLLFGFAGLLVLSPWLIRNVAWTHNPVFPLAMNVFGQNDFTNQQVARFVAAHSPLPDERGFAGHMHAVSEHVLTHWQFGYVLMPLTLLCSCIALHRRVGRFRAGLIVGHLVVWLAFTHLQPRFLTPIIPIAAAVCVLTLDEWPWAKPALWVLAFSSLVGFISLHGDFSTYLEGNSSIRVWIGMDEESLFKIAREHFHLPDDPDSKVALIGNAAPFRIPLSGKRLLYRSVFDVNVTHDDTIDSWLGQSVPELRRQGYLVEIDTGELKRLSESYEYIPPPQVRPEWKKDEDGYIFLYPEQSK